MTQPHYLDDLTVGQKFGSGRRTLELDAIRSFAAEFDPQPFHLDDAAAQATLFRGLAASGWHTAAVTMRLLVDSEFRPAGGDFDRTAGAPDAASHGAHEDGPCAGQGRPTAATRSCRRQRHP